MTDSPAGLALLAARFRRLDLAEDGLAEAFEAAARTWAEPPANPAAWVLVAAQRRITDRLRAEVAKATGWSGCRPVDRA